MELDHRKFLASDPKTVKKFVQATRHWVRKKITNPAQIDSVVQAAIVEMLTKLRAGNEPKPGKTLRWIQTCANNAVRRELTRARSAAAEERCVHERDLYPRRSGPNPGAASDRGRARSHQVVGMAKVLRYTLDA